MSQDKPCFTARPYEDYRGTGFFSCLDGLRCFSILAVIAAHTGFGIRGLHFSTEGALGVDLFFVISGFLITTLLLREREERGDISLKAFYFRRTLRIFPLYYAIIAVYVVLVLALENGSADGREFFDNLPYFLTYTSNWFVLLEWRVIFYFAWSLATEEQFYLLWSMAEKLLDGWRPAGLIVLLLVTRELARVAVSWEWVPAAHLGIVILLSIHPAILGGAFMAHVLHDRRTFALVAPFLGARWTALFLVAFLLVLIEFSLPVACVWTTMVLLVGAVSVGESGALATLLRWKPVAYLGTISYGMYLMHQLGHHVVEGLFAAIGVESEWLMLAGTVTATAFAAAVSYRYFESWFLRFKATYARTRTHA